MKLLHITDPHLVAAGELLYGLDPQQRLLACIADINQNHRDAALAVITGDLAHRGEIAAYRTLKAALATLDVPYRLLLGNHDNRANFFEIFPDSPRDENGFVQFTLDTAAGRFVCLDTNEPDVPWGRLCAARLDWLARTLDAAGTTPVYLFMHHPPFPVQLKRMDDISLREPEGITRIVRRHPGIRHLFLGHLHRPVAGSWLGIPFSTMRGTNHQVALDFVIAGGVRGSHEPPAYAIAFLDPEQVVVHFHDYLDRTATFML